MPAPWFNRCQPRRGVFRGRFAPGAPATLAAVLGVLVLVSLGLWQLERAAWKNALIARIHARIAAPTVSLPADLGGPGTAGGTDPAAYEYRHVSVTGRFLNDHELFLVARSRYGNDGLEIVTPLVRADGGGVVLVNRGWVPKERRAPGSRSAGRQDGTVTIEGIARMPPRRVWFLPDNRPDLNQWLFMDPPAMAASGVGLRLVNDRTGAPRLAFAPRARDRPQRRRRGRSRSACEQEPYEPAARHGRLGRRQERASPPARER